MVIIFSHLNNVILFLLIVDNLLKALEKVHKHKYASLRGNTSRSAFPEWRNLLHANSGLFKLYTPFR